MCICLIQNWYGRSGNNIIQVINCLQYAFNIRNCKHIEFPNNILFNNTKIVNSIKTYCSCNNIFIDKWNFFYAKYMNFKIQPYEMRNLAQKYIVPILSFNIRHNTYNDDDNNNNNNNNDDNELYIHIRGGDSVKLLLNSKDNIPKYCVQPPLIFYNTIIDKLKPKQINIIHQDNINPCLDSIKSRYNNTKLQSDTVVNDLKTLCEATNVISSFTTFILIVYFISPNLKNLYIPKYMLDEWFPIEENSWGDEIKLYIYDIPNYGNIDEWKKLNYNSRKERLLNTNYDITKI